MKKNVFLLIISTICLGSLTAYGQRDLRHPEHLGAFESVAIHIPAQTEIIRGSHTSVDIDMPDRIARRIEVYNDRGTLVIKSNGGAWIKGSDSVRIRITMPYWDSLMLSSSGELHSDDPWDSDEALIRVSGSGKINLNRLTARSAEISTSGSGDIILNSLTADGSVSIRTSGSGSVFIPECSASNMEVKLTGSGDFMGSIRSEALLARLSGSGSVTVSGYVRRAELQTSGSGEIDGGSLMCDEAYIKTSGSGDVSLKDGSRIKEIRTTGSGVFRSL